MFKSYRDVARYIDHTNLKPTATFSDMVRMAEEAEKYGFYAVCINPIYIPVIRGVMKRGIKVVGVVSFPLGATPVDNKIDEGTRAIDAGADELDVVSYIGYIKGMRYDLFQDEVESIVKYFRREHPNIVIKIIVDIPYLEDKEYNIVVDVINSVKPHFLKTSTGYAPRGTTVEDVKIFRKLLSREIKIKAAGGIRTYEQVLSLISVGADRIGTSTAVKIMEKAKLQLKG